MLEVRETNPRRWTPVARHDVVRRPQVSFLTTPWSYDLLRATLRIEKITNRYPMRPTPPFAANEKQTLPHVCCQQISGLIFMLRALRSNLGVRSCKTLRYHWAYRPDNLWQWLANKQIQKYLQVVPVKRQRHVCLQFVQLLSQCQETFVAPPLFFVAPKNKPPRRWQAFKLFWHFMCIAFRGSRHIQNLCPKMVVYETHLRPCTWLRFGTPFII